MGKGGHSHILQGQVQRKGAPVACVEKDGAAARPEGVRTAQALQETVIFNEDKGTLRAEGRHEQAFGSPNT